MVKNDQYKVVRMIHHGLKTDARFQSEQIKITKLKFNFSYLPLFRQIAVFDL